MTKRARLVVSVGCPSGIGPEVSVAAAAMAKARVLLVGDEGSIRFAARSRGLDDRSFVRVRDASGAFSLPTRGVGIYQPGPPLRAVDRRPGHPTLASGHAQLDWIDVACDLVANGEGDALVTGPVSKAAVVASKAPGSKSFRGHTEHLQERLAADEVVMAFWSEVLTTALVTTHLPLAKVPLAITPAKVATATFWLASLLDSLSRKPATGRRSPRLAPLAVAGLNPHAGEGGLLGSEETTVIARGITLAEKRIARASIAIDVRGPVPAESAFRLAKDGAFSGVVAMYHDQATIPMKLVGFGEAVNVSLGLPIIRTSVDHGTGYDRAGKGTASAEGMAAAMQLAARLSLTRRS